MRSRNRPPLSWRGELQDAEDDAGVEGDRPQADRQRPVRRRRAHLRARRPASPRRTPSRGSTRGRRGARHTRDGNRGPGRDAFEYVAAAAPARAASPRRAARNPPEATRISTSPLTLRRISIADPEARRCARSQGAAAPRARLLGMSSGSIARAAPLAAGRRAAREARRRPLDRRSTPRPPASIPNATALLAIGAVAVDDEGIRLADSFEVVLKQRRRPAKPRNIVVHGIGHGAQAAGTPPAAALAAFRRNWGCRRATRRLPHRFRSQWCCAARSPAAGSRRAGGPHGSTSRRWPGALVPEGATATAAGASTIGWRRSASKARSATTPRRTRSRPRSCCCGLRALAAAQGTRGLRGARQGRAPAEMAGQRRSTSPARARYMVCPARAGPSRCAMARLDRRAAGPT